MQFGLRDWAQREPQRVAVKLVGGKEISFGALETLANRFARLFRHLGLQRGDHIASVLGNSEYILALAWAAYRAGLYLTPVANTLTANEINYVVANSQSQAVIADQKYRAGVEGLPQAKNSARHFLSLGGSIPGFESLEELLARMPVEPIADESPGALMLYSSGTTGAPKGIWRPLPTAEQVGDGPPPFASDLIKLFDIRSSDRYLSPAPLYHAAPLRWSLAVIAAGGSAVVMGKFDAELALTLLEQEQIAVSQWVPTMFHRMLTLPEERRKRFRAPAHRLAYHAAAPISVPLKRTMIEWWGPIIQEYYGGSESVGLCSITTEEWLRKPGSVGTSRKGPIHILDENFQELAPGQHGTIFFSGISAFKYFGEPEKTAARTSPQGYQTFGDVGYVDQDGYLFLSDRLDDMIISGGVNIYPQEIEQALDEAPEVTESAVVGAKDPEYGERPIAFVVPDPASKLDPEQLRQELFAYCKQKLGRTKQPREIRFVESLPRSEAGKLLRRELRGMIEPAAK